MSGSREWKPKGPKRKEKNWLEEKIERGEILGVVLSGRSRGEERRPIRTERVDDAKQTGEKNRKNWSREPKRSAIQ